MSWIDWTILLGYLVWIIWSGVRYGRNREGLESYFLANRELPWWAVGLSVMATQMSAITLIGTTGQAYDDGMRFVQFYFGLPLAMIILSVTVVPFFHKAKVYTAYEYLEKRFDAKTRSLTSFFFLVSRCLGVGVIISAPAVVLSVVLGWPMWLTILGIGMTTTVYTMYGGVRAVTWTDVRQMAVIGAALAIVLVIIINSFPDDVSFGDALRIAGATGRLETVDTRFDWNEKYTLWSGLIGGLFLMLSYFGCDQSQVQRYLTAKSVNEGRRSLLMNAVFKIPLQFLILLIGVLVFVFYQFNEPPVVFNPDAQRVLTKSDSAAVEETERIFAEAHQQRREAAIALASEESEETRAGYVEANNRVQEIRKSAIKRAAEEAETGQNLSDVNYVFPTFVITELPVGVIGLFIAAIFAAAMSSISAELNALSTATVIDFYRRHYKPEASEKHYLRVSRLFTLGWGLFACVVAFYAVDLGSLIEVVNTFGSFFYGSLLGVFVLAFGVKRANGTGAFWGLLTGIATIAVLNNLGWIADTWESLTGSAVLRPMAESLKVSFLWYNVIGCLVVVLVGASFTRARRADADAPKPEA